MTNSRTICRLPVLSQQQVLSSCSENRRVDFQTGRLTLIAIVHSCIAQKYCTTVVLFSSVPPVHFWLRYIVKLMISIQSQIHDSLFVVYGLSLFRGIHSSELKNCSVVGAQKWSILSSFSSSCFSIICEGPLVSVGPGDRAQSHWWWWRANAVGQTEKKRSKNRVLLWNVLHLNAWQ